MKQWVFLLLVGCLLPVAGFSQVQHFSFGSRNQQIRIDILDDDLILFELAPIGSAAGRIEPSPFVAKRDYTGPTSFSRSEQGFKTNAVIFNVNASLCVSVRQIGNDLAAPVKICPASPDHPADYKNAFSIDPGKPKNAYGLGQQFVNERNPGSDGDWVAHGVREPGRWYKDGKPVVSFGNLMEGYNGGAAGNTQIPVLYAVGQGGDDFAVYLDNIYRQRWDFTKPVWKAEMNGDTVRYYFFAGKSLKDLRSKYMKLAGTPPVPPRKMFGLWVSEYGYENWHEIDDKLATLRKNRFPVDGFVMDLQWNGGLKEKSGETRIGRMTWDLDRFPNPSAKISEYKNNGIGLICIEDPVLGSESKEYALMKEKGFMENSPVLLGVRKEGEPDNDGRPWLKDWWGQGGLIDHTNPAARLFWHKERRQALLDQGILGIWTDLGEPELYYADATYYGGKKHADIHNLYNFFWNEGIYEGYASSPGRQRPFMLSRSGGPGSQRFGVAMWSGDIGARLSNLAALMNTQMHMSLSGIDYYGSDVGGFWHWEEDVKDIHSRTFSDLYTKWYANAAWFDVPLRPHTFNGDKTRETAPDRVGEIDSNLIATRQRYELIPYYYSLAHRAHLFAEPVVAPMVYHFENDLNVRNIGDQKMVGPFIMVKAVTTPGATGASIYLPAGRWFDYATGKLKTGNGSRTTVWPYDPAPSGSFRLPAFVTAGGIIPTMLVDDQTLDAFGNTPATLAAAQAADDLVFKIFPDRRKTEFTFYEDDGETVDYLSGKLRTTLISQQKTDGRIAVEFAAAAGAFNEPKRREMAVQVALEDNEEVTDVTLDGEKIDWTQAKSSRFVTTETLTLSADEKHTFVFSTNLTPR